MDKLRKRRRVRLLRLAPDSTCSQLVALSASWRIKAVAGCSRRELSVGGTNRIERRRVRLQLCSAPCFVKIYRWLRSPWATQTTQVWQVKADGSVQSMDYTTSWGASKKFSVAFGSSTSSDSRMVALSGIRADKVQLRRYCEWCVMARYVIWYSGRRCYQGRRVRLGFALF